MSPEDREFIEANDKPPEAESWHGFEWWCVEVAAWVLALAFLGTIAYIFYKFR